jgi:flagellar hook-associated protein 1
MTISGALSSALSGLTASARAAEIVASNVANAGTAGYARRVLETSARAIGGTGQGVQVDGVRREVDAAILADRRLAAAGAGGRDLLARFATGFEAIIGTPEDPQSLTARVAAFEQSLIAASARPDAEARLLAVRDTASALARQLGAGAAAVQDARMDADRDIATSVTRINAALADLADLNGRILSVSASGRDASALIDTRQKLIDSLAADLPVREVARDDGTIALFTTGGAVLLDGSRPASFGFQPAGIIVPEMTLASGGLSGLTLNGRLVATSGETSPVAGGRLAALFAVRDDLAVGAQAQLDAVARDLVARFSTPGDPDPTLAPGAPGLFTDAGTAFLPANEIGLSGRLTLNAAVDPAQGGGVWRLRDGLGATEPGPPGEARLLLGLSQAMTETRQPASGAFMAGARSFATLASDLLSAASAARLQREDDASFAAAQHGALREAELQDGVDTDQELTALMQIEKAYAANAKVIQAVDEMLQALLGIG